MRIKMLRCELINFQFSLNADKRNMLEEMTGQLREEVGFSHCSALWVFLLCGFSSLWLFPTVGFSHCGYFPVGLSSV